MCSFPCFFQYLQKMLALVCFKGYNWEISVSPLSQKKLFIFSFEDLFNDLANLAKSYLCTHIRVTSSAPTQAPKGKMSFLCSGKILFPPVFVAENVLKMRKIAQCQKEPILGLPRWDQSLSEYHIYCWTWCSMSVLAKEIEKACVPWEMGMAVASPFPRQLLDPLMPQNMSFHYTSHYISFYCSIFSWPWNYATL